MDKLQIAEGKVWAAFQESKISFTEVLIALSNIEAWRAIEAKKRMGSN